MSDELHQRRGRSRLRIIVAFVAGLVVGVVVGVFQPLIYALIAGWAAACIVYIVWVWTRVWGLNAASTRTHATLEDPGRRTGDLLLLIASTASIAAVVFILVDARHLHGVQQLLVALLAILSIALSWLLVHTLYMLRYARMYYRIDGGVDFNQDEPPAYTDFAYLSFTLGMTFQVSDTDVTSSAIRRAILRHTLLSYVFGTVILASTVNLVAALT